MFTTLLIKWLVTRVVVIGSHSSPVGGGGIYPLTLQLITHTPVFLYALTRAEKQ